MSEQIDSGFTEEDTDALAAAVVDMWTSGATVAQAKGITADECEAMYTFGHSLYGQGKYEDAFKIFARLVTYNHMESRYQMALASAMQMTGRYQEALQQYIVVTVMRLDDPVPVFHSAECQLALGQPEKARDSLELLIDALCQPGVHDGIKARAQALLKTLEAKAK
ncbi:SycD/LcrH family type III secretion system chaperone [Alcaligenes sp. WGS1538]|uniref:SycD/LcrH family type III secretion system chaperone n=1 Tax=Alcaligenes sp. WGS1538 TaxID=3366811 RepID=UPI00372D26B7